MIRISKLGTLLVATSLVLLTTTVIFYIFISVFLTASYDKARSPIHPRQEGYRKKVKLPVPSTEQLHDNLETIIVTKPRRNQTRIAILAIDDETNNIRQFYQSASSNLILKEDYNLTYFLFFRSIDVYLQYLLIPNWFSQDAITILVYLLPDEVNPCRVYLENSGFHRYFQASEYDYVFSFDARMEFLRPISVKVDLLGDFVLAPHPSFIDVKDPSILPYDRRPSSCAFIPPDQVSLPYLSIDMFGGKPDLVQDFCAKVMKCQYSRSFEGLNDINFHQAANHFLARNRPPTRILSPYFISAASINGKVHESLEDQPVIAFNDLARNPVPLIEDMWPIPSFDGSFYDQRKEKANTLVNALRNNYFQRMSPILERKMAKFVVLRPEERKLFSTIRGSVGLFFLALASERIFYFEKVPESIKSFFSLNRFNVTLDIFEENIAKIPRNSTSYIPHNRIDATPGKFVIPVGHLQAMDMLITTTNRTHSILKAVMEHREFYPSLHRSIPSISDYKGSIDLAVFTSAALQSLYGELTDEAENIVNNFILGVAKSIERWNDASKIGVQIRSCADCPDEERVRWHQLICFAEKLVQVIREQMSGVPRYIFVTNDEHDREYSRKINSLLQNVLEDAVDQNIQVIDANSSPYHSRDLLEWFLLTKMDWLIISRSNFGETASMLSLVPTERYDHSVISNATCKFYWFNTENSQPQLF